MALSVTISDLEHGAYYDHVTDENGSLYDLAKRLGIEPGNGRYPASETKRKYCDLAEYSQAHGFAAEVFEAAGWKNVSRDNRPALQFPTATGDRWRFIDGEKPIFKSIKGYKSCWYRLEEAVQLANPSNTPLVICNGEPSVISAQHFGIPAICVTSGEKPQIPEHLLLELQLAWSGKIIVAPDCDQTGTEMGHGFRQKLTEKGFEVSVVDLNGGNGFDLGDYCALNKEESFKTLNDLALISIQDSIPPTNGQQVVLPEIGSSVQEWKPFTLADAYQERPPIIYTVGKLFEQPSLNIMYGPPGCMKSFLLADLAGCVAGGVDWLVPRPNESGQAMPVTQGPVVWIDFDNGQRRTHDRFAAIGRAYKLPADKPLFYYSMPTPLLNARVSDQIEDFVAVIMRHSAKFVVIDNLGVISGGADENSAEMIEVLANLRWVAEITGAAVVVIHHSRKTNNSNERRGNALRGHSSIEAALDIALYVERLGASKTIVIEPTKVRGADVNLFAATFAFQNDAQGELYKAHFVASLYDEPVSDKAIMKTIYEQTNNDPINKGNLVKKVHAVLEKEGIGENRIRKIINFMCSQGNLIKTKGKNRAQLFSRNPEKPV